MTTIEEVRNAIAKLTEMREATRYSETNGWLVEDVPGASGGIDDPGYAPLTNDPMIVTLHRTINAQLGILRFVESNADAWTSEELAEVYVEQFALAQAINGERA